MSFSIVIASHGSKRWQRLAETRALPSTEGQGAEVLIGHEEDSNRATVRNHLAAQASGEWLVFLDADDELAPGYIEAMTKIARPNSLLTPAVSYHTERKVESARFWPECDLYSGNWMVVGTAVPASLFQQLGGWKHLDSTGVTNEYDDWHLWCRCVRAGATPIKVPDAVYIAHVMRTSKHRHATRRLKLAWHREVQEDVWTT